MSYAITYSLDSSMAQLFTTYSDTNHGGCKDTGRSTGAYIVKIQWLKQLSQCLHVCH